MSQVLISSLALMRRMPPSSTEKNLTGLRKLIDEEEVVDQVYQRTDKPMELGICEETGNQFILCELNRDRDSYRSPYSNRYQPAIPESNGPSEALRQVEIKANEVFNEYRRLYYSDGISSVYLWDTNPNEFAGAFLVKKDMSPVDGFERGSWESNNLISAQYLPETKRINFTITTTVFLTISSTDAATGILELSGSLSRQMQDSKPAGANLYADSHIYHIVSLVELMESKLRSSIDLIYIGKTQEIIDRTRRLEGESRARVKLA